MTGPPRQLPLPLPPTASAAAIDFVPDPSNAAALAWLDRPGEWPLGRLVLCGPAGCGKTHLLRATAAAHGWPQLAGEALQGLPAVPASAGVAIDDADLLQNEAALLHTLNICAERATRVLLAARLPPIRWPVRLPDLGSRLRATPVAPIGPPSDTLLGGLLAKHLADRQLRVDPAVQAWLLRRLARDAATVAEAAARLDRAALAVGRRIGLPLARAVLADLLGDDHWLAQPDHACQAADPLL